MNEYKILKCFRKEKRVSGELPCPATGLIKSKVSTNSSYLLADQAGLKQTRSSILENTFLRDGAHIKCTCTNLTNQKNKIKIAQETAVVVPTSRL